ncbi:MAG: hypothetical protein U5J83_19245 [Bryobacterales bacterium]|nr:hypothetical protein [Bryobacterales bacterium]
MLDTPMLGARTPQGSCGVRAGLQAASIRAPAEFEAFTPYLLLDLRDPRCEAQSADRKKVVILGSGPNRIGQGIEFDYCCCHASFALQEFRVSSRSW